MGSINPVALIALRERNTPPLTQEELALRIGINKGHLSRIESGQIGRTSPEVIRAIAAHLGVPQAAFTYPPCPDCMRVAS